jgi:diguanylate cyclase (GGDEF)-like protein
MTVVGYEALARIPARPPNAPDWWLERAGELNMRSRLEIACWRTIIALGPPPGDRLLFLNVSPATLAEPDLLALRDQLPERTVIEVTEQEAVADYVRVREDLEPWLSENRRLAIDDAGAGYSSLRHVVELVPDFIKIDRSLIQGIDMDRNRRALVHSLVAFAREVGITVIAEGVETDSELAIVRDAEVALAQGYLFARPSNGWPELVRRVDHDHDLEKLVGPHRRFSRGEETRLLSKLDQANDAKAACEAVVEFLYRRGQLLPSLYLELEGQLRCIAQRGLWQVLDGMSGAAGITGKTWASSRPSVVTDVRRSADYLEAIPGVMSEICVPIMFESQSIGALNVESLTSLSADTADLLERCADSLVRRLRVVGWRGRDLPWRRAGRASVRISELAVGRETPEAVLAILCDASGMDSACLIRTSERPTHEISAIGPLGSILAALPSEEISDLSRLVDHVNSCYTASDTMGRGFVGTESIRAFARAVIVLPLRSGGNRIGTVVLADSLPRALSGEQVEPLELIAGQLAATLDSAALVERLRLKANMDGLTGLGNRAGFEEQLAREGGQPDSARSAALIIDIDHFKRINDAYGHLVGDAVLRSVAAQLKSQSDGLPIFRYGGDEFVCLIPTSDSSGARVIADALCSGAARALVQYGSSVTAGLAIPRAAETPWTTFARADAALLTAKVQFRGTVLLNPDH